MKTYLDRFVEKKTVESREAHAKWAKDHPNLPPGTNPKGQTWKTYSKIRKPSEAFRDGYTSINWNGASTG